MSLASNKEATVQVQKRHFPLAAKYFKKLYAQAENTEASMTYNWKDDRNKKSKLFFKLINNYISLHSK